MLNIKGIIGTITGLLFIFNTGITPLGAQSKLTAAQLAGKKIYEQGEGTTDTPIEALMSGVKVSAKVMPCANCHKKDGTGNPEGGVVPSNLTWGELTKPYQKKAENGRSHPAYTEQALRKAISMGIDPAKNELNLAMPRYSMSRVDLDNLIAYLKVIGKTEAKGVTQDEIKLGVVLPNYLESRQQGKVYEALVKAHVSEINVQGGIFNRKLQPDFIYLPENASDDEVKATLEQHKDFMLIGSNLFQEEAWVTDYAHETATPVVLPFSVDITKSGLKNKEVFYLFPSLLAETITLIEYAQQNQTNFFKNQVIIVHDQSPIRKNIVGELETYIRQNYGHLVKVMTTAELERQTPTNNGLAKENQWVIYLGSPQWAHQWLNQLSQADYYPKILVPGSVSGINVFKAPAAFTQQIFTSYPTWANVITKDSWDYYGKLVKKYGLDTGWKTQQMNLLSMLRMAEESLKQSGKDLQKDNVVAAYESFFQYATGYTPPVSYNLNERTGSRNIYITTYNHQQKGIELIATVSSKH